MTWEQIKKIVKVGAQRATSVGFAATSVQQRHAKRLAELKKRLDADRKHNEAEMELLRAS